MSASTEYISKKMESHAPLDEADPLESYASTLTIGNLDPVHKKRVFDAMVLRACDAVTNIRKTSDQGSHFKNEIMHRVAEALSIKHHLTKAYHP